jgi:hypothetical protein
VSDRFTVDPEGFRVPSDAEIRLGVWERQHGQCARCGGPLGDPESWAWSNHHRRLRSAGGSDLPANRLGLDGSGTTGCHGWVHHNPAHSRKVKGWIVSRYQDPAITPVFIQGMGLVLLDDQFGVTAFAVPPWKEEAPDG